MRRSRRHKKRNASKRYVGWNVFAMNTNSLHHVICGTRVEPSLEAKLNEKIDKQTEDFKGKIEISRIFLSSVRISGVLMESSHTTLKRKS
jgi:hypothetical protein